MPLPGNVSTGTVTGTFTKTDGSPAVGSVSFKPNPRYILDASANVVLTGMSQIDVLDGTGSFSLVLAATDDADLNPVGWTWDVYVELDGQPNMQFSMLVPGGVTTDVADVMPVASSSGLPYIVGPTGSPGLPAPPNNLWMPAQVFTATGGTPTLYPFGGGTSPFPAWLFDQTAPENVTGVEWLPDEWLTFAMDLWWTNQGAGSGNVKWGTFQYQVQDTGVMTTLDRSALPAAIAAPVAMVMKVTALDTAIPNLGGARAFTILRDAAHASDTLANDAAFVGLNLRRLT